MTSTLGLRERKKVATRTALGEAAVALALEHGPEHVTPEMIAAAANVSTRTFHNYFGSKEEAILYLKCERVRSLIDQLRARPADEPIWTAITAVCVGAGDVVSPSDPHIAVAEFHAIDSNPHLSMYRLRLLDEMRHNFVAVIAERTGTDPDTDLYPKLVAGAAVSALKASFEIWMANPSRHSVAALVSSALDQIRGGMPQPAR